MQKPSRRAPRPPSHPVPPVAPRVQPDARWRRSVRYVWDKNRGRGS